MLDDAITIPAAIVVSAMLMCVALIIFMRPLFKRYALARPNARSSHTVLTRQGGGIAVAGHDHYLHRHIVFGVRRSCTHPLAILFSAAVLIAIVGVVADIPPIMVAAAIAAAGGGGRRS